MKRHLNNSDVEVTVDGLVSTAIYYWNTQTLSWVSGTQPISGGPSDATAANQIAGNSSLSSIDAKLSSQATATNQATANLSLSDLLTDSRLTTRVDEASTTVTYVGKAIAGSLATSAAWRISRITISGTITTIEYADGNVLQDNIWNNRASLSYS